MPVVQFSTNIAKLAPVAKTSVGSQRFKPNFIDLKYFFTGNNNINDFHVQEQAAMKHRHSQSAFCFSFKLSNKFYHRWRIQETIK